MALTVEKNAMELKLDLFALAKSFDELVKDMFNNSFSQTIVLRKSELYSDYKRTDDGYLLLNNSSSILRVEVQKQMFPSNVTSYLGTKPYVFNPYFSEFVNTNIPTTEEQNAQIQSEYDTAQQELLDAQQQIQELLKDVNSVLNDKDNMQKNYEKMIQDINAQVADLQQKYEQANKKIMELNAENIRIAKMYVTASNKALD